MMHDIELLHVDARGESLLFVRRVMVQGWSGGTCKLVLTLPSGVRASMRKYIGKKMLKLFGPILEIVCDHQKFCFSKQLWEQFAYFRLCFTEHEARIVENKLTIEAPDDMLPFCTFLKTTEVTEIFVHFVRNMCVLFGMDLDGYLAGILTMRLQRWASNCSCCSDNLHSAERAFGMVFYPKNILWSRVSPFNVFRHSMCIKNAFMSSVLPLDGEPSIDIRNLHAMRSLAQAPHLNARQQEVRQHLLAAEQDARGEPQ